MTVFTLLKVWENTACLFCMIKCAMIQKYLGIATWFLKQICMHILNIKTVSVHNSTSNVEVSSENFNLQI